MRHSDDRIATTALGEIEHREHGTGRAVVPFHGGQSSAIDPLSPAVSIPRHSA